MVFVVGALLALPAVASATTRYAAPGGTAPDTVCTVPTTPCSIGAAAGGPDVVSADEAVILPGNYSDTAAISTVTPETRSDGVSSHAPSTVLPETDAGDHGQRARFDVPNPYGAFLLSATALSYVKINAGASASGALTVGFGSSASVAEHVIATSTRDNAITCNHWNGIIRDSVSSSSGSGGNARAVRASPELIGTTGTTSPSQRHGRSDNQLPRRSFFFGGSSAN